MVKNSLVIFLVLIFFNCQNFKTPVVYDKTIKDLEKELEIIQLLMKGKNFELAESNIDKDLKIYPDNPELLHMKGWLLLEEKNLEGAEKIFLSLVEGKKKNPLANAGLARIMRLKGNLKEAKKYIENALTDIYTIPLLWLERGLIEYEEKNYKKALIDFNKAYMLDTRNNDILFFKYLTMLVLNRDINEIKIYWQKILEAKEKKSWYFLYHAAILEEKKLTQDAQKVLSNGLTFFPDDGYLLNMNAYLLYKEFLIDKNKKEEIAKAKELILRCIEQSQKIEPEFVDTYFAILEILEEKELLVKEINKYFLMFPERDIILAWVKKYQ